MHSLMHMWFFYFNFCLFACFYGLTAALDAPLFLWFYGCFSYTPLFLLFYYRFGYQFKSHDGTFCVCWNLVPFFSLYVSSGEFFASQVFLNGITAKFVRQQVSQKHVTQISALCFHCGNTCIFPHVKICSQNSVYVFIHNTKYCQG